MLEAVTKAAIKKEIPKRTRAFSTRAKTGCKTCKVRHVKCDEGRPGCRKCAQTGRQCDGYSHCTPSSSPKPSTISSAVIPKPHIDLRNPPSPAIPEFLSPSFANEQEQRSLHFFHTQTAPQLGGCFGSTFWNHFVLQASRQEPAVRFAAIALGSLHERFELEDSLVMNAEEDTEENSFALRQYVRAINCLVQPDMCMNNRHTKKSANVALTTCLLFICFETLRGHHDAALAHIGGGVKILSEWESSEDPPKLSQDSHSIENIPVSEFRILFSRLDTHATPLISRARMIDDYESDSYASPIPSRLHDLQEARESLESVWSASTRNLLACSMHNEIPLPSPITRDELFQMSSRLGCWNEVFESYVRERSSQKNFNTVDRQAINTLRIHKTITEIWFSASTAARPLTEMFWDTFKVKYDAITKWAAEIIQIPSNIHPEASHISTFTLDSGIIQPLFLVAAKCRYRKIRSRAIALLNRANRQEGLWNSALIARVAERIHGIEEVGLAEAVEIVPEVNRVRDINMRFDFQGPAGRRAWLEFRHPRLSPTYEIGEWIVMHEPELLSVDMRKSISDWTNSTINSKNVAWCGAQGTGKSNEAIQEIGQGIGLKIEMS